MKRRLALVALSLLAGACDIASGTVPIEATGDRDDWAAHVQPYVSIRCGTLDCHGDPGRPFRVYSEEGLRIDPDRELPLSDLEVDENVTAALGVGPQSSVDDHPLLLEPLHRDVGGFKHEGDTVWLSRDEPGYRCLRDWLSGADPSASCAEAVAAVPRNPPL